MIVRDYCFISGNIEKENLKEIIHRNFKDYTLIPNDNIAKQIEEIYQNSINKLQRYSMKEDFVFDTDKLEKMSNDLKYDF